MATAKGIQLSPNSLNLFLECPHCFWLEKNLNIKRPSPYPYTLNAAVDGVLKEEFDTYRQKKMIHPLLDDTNLKLFSNQRLLNQWRNPEAGIRFYDEKLKATLIGAPDDVVEFQDGKVAPLDYKSTGNKIAKVYDMFQLQMDVYSFLLEKNGYKTKKKGYLAFYVIDKSKGFVDKIPFQKKIVEIETNPGDVYDIFKDAVKALALEQPPKHSRDCTFAKWLEKARNFAH